jgi:hypothetical protein
MFTDPTIKQSKGRPEKTSKKIRLIYPLNPKEMRDCLYTYIGVCVEVIKLPG